MAPAVDGGHTQDLDLVEFAVFVVFLVCVVFVVFVFELSQPCRG
ncbi:hypothetical protein ABT009_37370 [Streptomyces sp. NPDC002896]